MADNREKTEEKKKIEGPRERKVKDNFIHFLISFPTGHALIHCSISTNHP